MVKTQQLTYSVFRKMDFPEEDNYFYELLNGILVKKSAPSIKHQRAVRNFFKLLDTFVSEKDLGEVLFAPVDVKLSEYSVPQPDILFVKKDRLAIINEAEGYVDGAPDLVVEVISPSSVKHDRIEKFALYEQYEISEYWLIDPQNQSVEVYTLKDGQYQLSCFAELEEEATSVLLVDFKLVFEQLN